jgi:hypothetical protein
MMIGDVKIAYLSDMKARAKTPGRDKRQVALKKDETLSDYTLKEIEFDNVVMVQGEDKITVYLNDPKKDKKRSAVTKPVKRASTGSGRNPLRSKATTKQPYKAVKKSSKPAVSPPVRTDDELPVAERKESAKKKLLDIFKRGQ